MITYSDARCSAPVAKNSRVPAQPGHPALATAWNKGKMPREQSGLCPYRSNFSLQVCPRDNYTEEFQPHWQEEG